MHIFELVVEGLKNLSDEKRRKIGEVFRRALQEQDLKLAAIQG